MASKFLVEKSESSNDSLTNYSSINPGIFPSKYSLEESGVNYKKCSLVSKISCTNYSSKKSVSCCKRSIKSSRITSSLFITIVFILIIQSTLNINYYADCHPVSSLHMCHGLQQGSKYTYKYHTLMLLNNHDHKGKEPVGFGYAAHFSLENVWEDEEHFLLKITFAKSNDGGHFVTRKGDLRGGLSHSKLKKKKEEDIAHADKWPLYALVRDKKEEQVIKSFFVHNGEDLITRVNLKKTLIQLTRSKPSPGVSASASSNQLSSPENQESNSGKSADERLVPNQMTNGQTWTRKGQEIHKSFKWSNLASESESILLPEMMNEWVTVSEVGRDHSVIVKSDGWQNVTFRSRIYNEAYSKLHLTYKLELIEEESSSETTAFQSARSLSSAMKVLGDDYIQQDIESDECPKGSCSTLDACPSGVCAAFFSREKQVCHECRTLAALVSEYEDFMTDQTAASVQAGISYLKVLDRVRSAGPGTTKEDMMTILSKYAKKDRIEMVSSLLDIYAGARTESSISASFDYLNLPANDDLDICERFLTTLAASCSTGAIQSLSDPSSSVPSHKFVVQDVLRLLSRDTYGGSSKWTSSKVRWSTILTLGSLLKSHNLMTKRRLVGDANKRALKSDKNSKDAPSTDIYANDDERLNEVDDQLSAKKSEDLSGGEKWKEKGSMYDDLTIEVISFISKELDSCKDTDCKVAILHALGNAGHLKLSIGILERYALDVSGKRESIAAMKAIKDCLEDEVLYGPLDDSKLIYRLRILVLKIVYDSNHESTSRIIAAEIIAKYLADEVLSQQLLQQLPGFGNNEMATLMWKRALKLSSSKEAPLNNNWLIQSTLFNGTSSAFTRNIGGTNTMNATYGVAMELLSGKLLKESSFDFFLGDQKNQQHILSVGLFARGLSSFAGSSSDPPAGDEDESTMAGMALRIMGMQLRPYKFFSSTTELMGHVWSGTASEPTTAYRGNLLMADHEDGIGLINGFILEQRLRGVLSLDLSGEIQISLWNRNSHAVVRSKAAALMQGSQAILTADPSTSASQFFTFGGSTSIDTTTDTDFYSTPFKMCVKMTQPEFILRHNTRKYEQVNEEQVHRRIHRRNYLFPAKSYALHPKIQEVCQSLSGDD